MQRCPTCNLLYADDAPPFCPDDGVRLVEEAPTSNPQPPAQGVVAHANQPQPPSAPQPQYAPQQWAPPPQARGGGGSKLMLGVLIGILLAGGVGAGIYFLTKGSGASTSSNVSVAPGSRSASTSAPSTPTQAWKAYYTAAQTGDATSFKALMSSSFLNMMLKKHKSADEALSEESRAVLTKFTSETRNEKITGGEATFEVRTTDGGWETVTFVMEDGSWKFQGSFFSGILSGS